MSEEHQNTDAKAYLDGEPLETCSVDLPEITVDPDLMAAVYENIRRAWEGIRVIAESTVEQLKKWILSVAAEVEAQHEMETAMRWASVDNRPLYNRYIHTKKKRSRKKYAKRILEWYRTEVDGGA